MNEQELIAFWKDCFVVKGSDLYWKHSRPLNHFKNTHGKNYWESRFGGKKAGNLDKKNGYIMVKVLDESVLAHRIVFAITFDFLPPFIDHIDRDKLNNSPTNLRESSIKENRGNIPAMKGSSSKYKGVCWSNGHGKFVVKCAKNHLGYFTDEVFAAHIYDIFAETFFKDFAYLNRDHFDEVRMLTNEENLAKMLRSLDEEPTVVKDVLDRLKIKY